MKRKHKIWVAVDEKMGLMEGGCSKDDLDDRLSCICTPTWDKGICSSFSEVRCRYQSTPCRRYEAELVLKGRAQ